jgi:hypothetical protein
VDGQPRFASRPLALPARQVRQLYRAAERWRRPSTKRPCRWRPSPALLDEFFALTPVQKLLWESSAPLWHGMARADLFLVDGARRARGRLLRAERRHAQRPAGGGAAGSGDRGAAEARSQPDSCEARFGELLDRSWRRSTGRTDRARHGGDRLPDGDRRDFALIRCTSAGVRRAGCTCAGSPYNLQPAPGGRVALFGTTCDLLIRHYKTDWWGERLPIWADEDPYPDPDPLSGRWRCCCRRSPPALRRGEPVRLGADAEQADAGLPVERQQGLSRGAPGGGARAPAGNPALEAADRARLASEQADWVLKSDYGCEGEEVIIGQQSRPRRGESAWTRRCPAAGSPSASSRPARPGRRHRQPRVYLVAGRAAGLYARLSSGATDVAPAPARWR